MDKYQLRDWSHKHLPEWKDPQGSSRPILFREVLAVEGYGEDEVRAIERTLAAEEFAARLDP